MAAPLQEGPLPWSEEQINRVVHYATDYSRLGPEAFQAMAEQAVNANGVPVLDASAFSPSVFNAHPLFEERRLQLVALSGLLPPAGLQASFTAAFSSATLQEASRQIGGSGRCLELERCRLYALAMRFPQQALADAMLNALNPDPLISGRLGPQHWQNAIELYKTRIHTLFGFLSETARLNVVQRLLALDESVNLRAAGAAGVARLEQGWLRLSVISGCLSEDMRAAFVSTALRAAQAWHRLPASPHAAQALSIVQKYLTIRAAPYEKNTGLAKALQGVIESMPTRPASPDQPFDLDIDPFFRSAIAPLLARMSALEQQWVWRRALDTRERYVSRETPRGWDHGLGLRIGLMQSLVDRTPAEQALLYWTLAQDPELIRDHAAGCEHWDAQIAACMAGAFHSYPKLAPADQEAAKREVTHWAAGGAVGAGGNDRNRLILLLARAKALAPLFAASGGVTQAELENQMRRIREAIVTDPAGERAVANLDAIARQLHRAGPAAGRDAGRASTAAGGGSSGPAVPEGGSSSSSSSSGGRHAAGAGDTKSAAGPSAMPGWPSR